MKRVLLLGSGYVSGPVIEYLTRDPGTQITVGKALKRKCCTIPTISTNTQLMMNSLFKCLTGCNLLVAHLQLLNEM